MSYIYELIKIIKLNFLRKGILNRWVRSHLLTVLRNKGAVLLLEISAFPSSQKSSSILHDFGHFSPPQDCGTVNYFIKFTLSGKLICCWNWNRRSGNT